jgi:glutathione peroxidase
VKIGPMVCSLATTSGREGIMKQCKSERMNRLMKACATVVALAAGPVPVALAAECPAWLQHDMRVLHSDKSRNLCESYRGRPMVIVNTASHCGFTKQFKSLEALYQRYKDRGLAVVGFPSNDFKQEEAEESDTAKICYVNFGVTFDMYATSHVRGDNANPVFAELARAEGAPKWNFFKYLVDRDGRVVAKYSSMTAPDDEDFIAAVDALVNTP